MPHRNVVKRSQLLSLGMYKLRGGHWGGSLTAIRLCTRSVTETTHDYCNMEKHYDNVNK